MCTVSLENYGEDHRFVVEVGVVLDEVGTILSGWKVGKQLGQGINTETVLVSNEHLSFGCLNTASSEKLCSVSALLGPRDLRIRNCQN